MICIDCGSRAVVAGTRHEPGSQIVSVDLCLDCGWENLSLYGRTNAARNGGHAVRVHREFGVMVCAYATCTVTFVVSRRQPHKRFCSLRCAGRRNDRPLDLNPLRTRQRGAATRLGISLETYVTHIEAGEAWCFACRAWQDAELFYRASDDSRRYSGCRASHQARRNRSKAS